MNQTNPVPSRARVVLPSVAALSALLVMILAAVGSTAAFAGAEQSNESFEFAISGLVSNRCPGGEDLNVTGDGRTRIHVVQTPSGNLTFRQQIQGKAVGIGVVTGTSYQLRSSSTGIVQMHASGNETSLVTSDDRIVGPAPDNDFVQRTTSQIVINANGTPVVNRSDSTVECR